MHVCLCMCMYACMFVCMYACVYILQLVQKCIILMYVLFACVCFWYMYDFYMCLILIHVCFLYMSVILHVWLFAFLEHGIFGVPLEVMVEHDQKRSPGTTVPIVFQAVSKHYPLMCTCVHWFQAVNKHYPLNCTSVQWFQAVS